MQNMNWYATLLKPPLTPPDAVFAPVWSILYVMIAVSLIVFLRSESGEKKNAALWCFGVQMSLNLSWTGVFFGMKSPDAALAVLAALFIFLVLTIRFFYMSSRLSAFLLLPYAVWSAFALYLNAGIVFLNG